MEKLFVTALVAAGATAWRPLLLAKIWQVTWTGGWTEETVPLMLNVWLVSWALAAGLVRVMRPGAVFETKLAVIRSPLIILKVKLGLRYTSVPIVQLTKAAPVSGVAVIV